MKAPVRSALFLSTAIATPAMAELAIEDRAPSFAIEAALAGDAFDFSLEEALSRGPVILYFYPIALTGECLVENYEFSRIAQRLNEWGATLIGVSGDSIDTVTRSSVLECSSKFPVGADPTADIIRAYDAEDPERPGRAKSVAYLIAPDGLVVFSHVSVRRDPKFHVEAMVDALAMWRAEGGASR
jgi:peroxiredoxin